MSTKKNTSRISSRNTELIDLSSYDLSRLHFDDPVENEIKQGSQTIKYFNISLGSKNGSGLGEFIFDIPFMAHSFGISEFQDAQGRVSSHTVSVSLVDTNNPMPEQLELVKKFSEIVDKIKDHLVLNKKAIKKPTLDKNDLKSLNPMRQPVDEDGNPSGNAWYFSPKLMERKMYKKSDDGKSSDEFEGLKIETKFYMDGQFDENDDPLEVSPLQFLSTASEKKHFKFRGAIKLDKIYIGSKISLQCKIYDGVVQNVENKRKRLVRLSSPNDQVSSSVSHEEQEDADLLLED